MGTLSSRMGECENEREQEEERRGRVRLKGEGASCCKPYDRDVYEINSI